jgi:hypothetical protein
MRFDFLKYTDFAKNEDDGALFATFIKEAKFPAEAQSVKWETIRDIFQKYHVRPCLAHLTIYPYAR